jgi:RNA polymerase sigma-70 factor (ECF subfamily)
MIYNIDIAADKLADDSANDSAEATSLNNYIMKILNSQPRMRRKVFMMSRFDNLTYAEIANRLNISERTVEAHIYAMVRELKKMLGYVPAAVMSLLYLSVKLY